MTPQIREETAKTAVFRQRWQAWKVVRSIAAVRQRPRTPRNWRCSFAFFESFLWHFNKKQHAEVIFRLSKPVLCKNQENGSGKQWSLHAPLKKGWAAPGYENHQPKKRKIEIRGRRSLLDTMRQTTRSNAYSFREAIFAPAPLRWALTRFPRSCANLTVLSKKDRRSLEAAAGPWFWRKDRQSLPTFVSFFVVSVGGMSRKQSAETRTKPTTVKLTSKWAILPN